MIHDARRLVFVLVTMGIALVGSIISARLHGGWVSATVLNVVVNVVLIGYLAARRDDVLLRFWILGAIGGIVELIVADPWGVRTGTLVYPPGGPFLIDSPAYMPLGWTYVLLQIGFIAWWVMERWGGVSAAVVATILGGINIPTYEVLARSAGWWYYRNTPMILGAPYYVILGEALIGLSLPFFVRPVVTRPIWWSVPIGVVLGLWTWGSAWSAFQLVG